MARLIAALLLLVGLSGPVFAETFSVRAPEARATFKTTRDGDSIFIPGFCTTTPPGDPALPFVDMCVILPPDADLDSITAVLRDPVVRRFRASRHIAPAPPASTVVDGKLISDYGPGKHIVSGRNQLVYGQDRFYPPAHVVVLETGWMRKWVLARLRYYPYRYNPVSRELESASCGAIDVSYKLKPASAALAAGADHVLSDTLRSLAVNFDQARRWYSSPALAIPSPDASPQAHDGYLIITTSAIAAGSARFQNFVSHKAARGFRVQVVTEAQWGGGMGDAAADNIRAYLKANYIAQSIKYVLLVGDPNPQTGAVPMKMLWPRHNSGSYREAPSDCFYADLTGNWDLDGDGFSGEGDDDVGHGGADRFADVIVGRIPFYGSFSDLDSILQKTIDYESGRDAGEWLGACILSMEPSDSRTPGYHLGEAIKADALDPAGVKALRVYDDLYDLSPQPEFVPCDYRNVLQAWQRRAGFHFWWTHGSETLASDVFSSSRCEYLDDHSPSFTFQASCSNGAPEHPDNLAYALLRCGAIAADSATRTSWFYSGQTVYTNTDSNAGMAYRYATKLVRDSLPCGDAHYAMMAEIPSTIWANHCVFNLYGDPSLAPASSTALAEAKGLTDGRAVRLSGKIVTCSANGYCYVQEPDRTSGIRLRYADWLAPLSVVDVSGTVNSDHGEVVIDVESARVVGTVDGVAPWAMKTNSLTGAGTGRQQPAMEYRLVRYGTIWRREFLQTIGLHNVGLLVRVFGRVTSAAADHFYVDDGASCDDGSGLRGVRVICGGFAKPKVGDFVLVDAVSSLYLKDGSLRRALVLPDPSSVRALSR